MNAQRLVFESGATIEDPSTKSSPSILATGRILAFPLLTNFWLALLFVSQKFFVIPGLVFVGFGDRAYRRDVLLAISATFVAILTYILQYPNPYAQDHLIGFLLFAASIPIINHAIRHRQNQLLKFLAFLTLFNAVVGFFFLFSDVDLTTFRGLNKVVGKDGITGRVYFESSSLAAVFLVTSFRNKWLRIISLLLVAGFVVFVARSVVVIMLLFVNLSLPYILKRSPVVKLIVAALTACLFILVYNYLPVLRPDVDLSLNAKQFQLDLILGSIDNAFTGWGWGTFFPELATDVSQPYQVEMQLPMLMLQVGVVPFLVIAIPILGLFISGGKNPAAALARFGVYMLIGFNNPWLFLPSWFLTCQLLFRYGDES